MKLFMKYQWLLYVIGWFVFQLFPAYFRLTSVADEFIPFLFIVGIIVIACLLYTSPSPRDGATSRMPSSA